MIAFRLPVDTFVWTTEGPLPLGALRPPASVAIIAPNGRVALSAVLSAPDVGDQPVIRLLTTAGDVLVGSRSTLTARVRRVFADDLAEIASRGGRTRIEVAHVCDLPEVATSRDRASIIRGALGLLDPPVARVPAGLGALATLAQLLEEADVRYVDASTERWSALSFDPAAIAPELGLVCADEAPVLQSLTAWTPGVSRVAFTHTTLRRRLVQALAAAGTPAKVTWTPAYGPVETRVAPGISTAFATVTSAVHDVARCRDLVIADAGLVVADLALIGGEHTATAS